MDVIEAMQTCIAMRYLKEDPIPREDLERLVYAATRASSAANKQGWEFVILTDASLKEEIGAAVSAIVPLMDAHPEAKVEDGVIQRSFAGLRHLVTHFAQVPAWIFACGRVNYPPEAPTEIWMHSSIYPAVQNLIVAARAMGLGTTFTTLHMGYEEMIRATLDLPEDVHPCAMVAVGYPDRPFGPVRRKPVGDVIHWNGW